MTKRKGRGTALTALLLWELASRAAGAQRKECTADMFTVVMPTFGAGPFHRAALWQFDSLHPFICEFILVWDKPDDKMVEMVKTDWMTDFRIPMVYDIEAGRDGTLSNRYKPYDEVRTDAILQIDDDNLVRPHGVIAALHFFQEHPDQLVSLASCVKAPGGYRYQTLWTNPYSNSCEMGMTNAALLHKKYHKLYWEESKLMVMVHAHHNCEDIGMNYVIEKELRRALVAEGKSPLPKDRTDGTNVYLYPPARQMINANHMKNAALRGMSPIDDPEYDAARLKRWHGGISTNQTGHPGTRDRCVAEFRRLFGFYPEVQSPYALTWHPDCFPGMRGHCHDSLKGEVRFDYSNNLAWINPSTGKEIDPGWPPMSGTGDTGYLIVSMDPALATFKSDKLQEKAP